jgi:hypothetical protein
MNDIINQILIFLNGATGVAIVLAVLVGGAMTYAGFRLYRIVMFLIGMIPGLVIGGAIGAAMGWPEIGIIFTAIVCGWICGVIAMMLIALSLFLFGGFIGSLIAVGLGIQEPVAIIFIGFIGGAIFIGLHNLAIVIGTAITGSGLLLFASLNLISLLQHGHPAYMAGSFLSYVGMLGRRVLRGGSLDSAFQMMGGHMLLFLVFLVTGIAVQLRFHRVLKGAESTDKESTESTVDRGVSQREQPRQIDPPREQVPKSQGVKWRLHISNHGDHVKSVDLHSGEYNLGRDEQMKIVVDDGAVSREHIRIRVGTNGPLQIIDTGSSNGTWKQGREKIEQEVLLVRDWFQIGTVQLLFDPVQ